MRILANENVPGPVIDLLRRNGHDVAWVRDRSPGASDQLVMPWAAAESRLLLTCDKDFGELAVAEGRPAPAGVILLRLSGSSPAVDNARAARALESRSDWAGHFCVVEDERIRMRPLQRSAPPQGE